MTHPGHQITESLTVHFVGDAVQISQRVLLDGGVYVSDTLILPPEVAGRLGKALIELAGLAPEPVVA